MNAPPHLPQDGMGNDANQTFIFPRRSLATVPIDTRVRHLPMCGRSTLSTIFLPPSRARAFTDGRRQETTRSAWALGRIEHAT
jgi:hypothetical protein